MNRSGIRFGGQNTDDGFRFELTGGALALDFVNTLNERAASPRELLHNYRRLVEWSMQSGALVKPSAAALLRLAGKNPRRAGQALRKARRLREFLFEVFSKVVAGNSIEKALIDEFNRWCGWAFARLRIRQTGEGFSWTCEGRPDDLAAMLWPVVLSASDLLASERLRTRLRICNGPTCEWLFLDNSRRQNRRWCDMTVCGNRAKARRHRQRSSGRNNSSRK